MPVRHHRALRLFAALTGLALAVLSAPPAHAQTAPAPSSAGAVGAPATPTSSVPATTPSDAPGPSRAAGDDDVAPAEWGVTSTEVAPAEAGESAQAVPFTGTQQVWCTQGNPSPGICGSHHTYPAIDLGMPVGTPVYATGPGVVIEARSSDSDARGLYVAIHHPDDIYSRYLHLSSLSVRVGDSVVTGTPIGRSGESGTARGSPHLHYDEQRPYGTPKELGDMVGLVGAATATYPAAFGYSSWRTVPFNTPMRNDGYAPVAPVTPHQWGGPAVTTGDFDGDGHDDLASGVPGKDTAAAYDAGAVTVLYGSEAGATTAGSQQLAPGVNGLAGTAETGDTFGASVAAGDFNGDRYADLAIGVPREDTEGGIDTGAIIVVPGSAEGLVAAGGRQRWSGAGSLPGAASPGDQLGAALAVGDFDTDGLDDLAIGVPGDDTGAADAGAVVVARGTANGLSGSRGLQLVSGSGGLVGTSQVGDLMGASLATGDLDGDGHDDLAIGCPGQDVGRASNAGQVIAVAGSPEGITRRASRQVRAGVSDIAGRSERDDVFGASVVVGDANGNGPADLIVGAPGEDAAAVNDGAIVVVPGSPLGLSGAGSRQYWSGSPGSAGVAEDQDLLGTSLAVGDVEGDGRIEILAGAPGKDVGGAEDAGSVLVVGSIDGVLTADSPDVAGRAGATDRFGRAVAVGDLNGDGVADLVATAPTRSAAGVATTGTLTTVPGMPEAGLTGRGSRHFVRGQQGLAGAAKKGDQFGGLLPPYLF